MNNKTVRIALGLAVSALCLWLIFRNISIHEVMSDAAQSKKIWFLVIFISMLFGHALRTLRWGALLSPVKSVPFTELFMLLTFGFFMNNVLPARGGELLRAYATNRETQVPTSTCLGSIALERLTDLIGLLFVMGVASAVLPSGRVPVAKIAGCAVAGLLVAGLLVLLLQKHKNSGRSLPAAAEWVLSFLKNLTAGFSALKSPSKMALVFVLSVVIWFFEIVNVLMAGRAFSLALPFSHAAATLIGIAVGVMIPAAPGYIGTYEFFGQRSMVFLGYPASVALSLILVLHVFQLIVNSLLGLPGFFKVRWEPRN